MSDEEPYESERVELPVSTRHPEDYVLINERNGTRWRGDRQRGWIFDSPDDKPPAGK